LGLEGAQAIEGKTYQDMSESLDVLYEKGVRIVGLVHYVDNEYAGSFSGVRKYGLTEKGLWLVKEIERRQMLIDLSHSSEQTVTDVLELYDLGILSRSLIFSHGGLFGHCPNVNLISDEQAKSVASKGGVIGLAFFGRTLCGESIDDMVDAIEYGIQLVGEDHVSLGTDFDGAIPAPVDASGLGLITEKLMERGLNEEQIRKIMGENTLRVLTSNLP
jgi:membrane dipeptidase